MVYCRPYGPIIVSRGSKGAELHKDLETDRIAAIFRKGMDPEVDSYSGFYDNNHQLSTGLAGYLKEKGASEIYFCGLAADICVYYSILDSILEGFSATLIEDASRPLYPDKFDDIKCELAKLEFVLSTVMNSMQNNYCLTNVRYRNFSETYHLMVCLIPQTKCQRPESGKHTIGFNILKNLIFVMTFCKIIIWYS